MPDLEAIEVLTQAKERLFEHGWGQFTFQRRKLMGDSESMCLEESLCGTRGRYLHECGIYGAPERASDYIVQTLGLSSLLGGHLFIWNDTQTSATPVFEALDAAILLAKEAPTPG